MLILLWILYVVACAVFYCIFYTRLTQHFNIDWIGHGLITICSVIWPFLLIIAMTDAIKIGPVQSMGYRPVKNVEYSIFVPQELLGIEGNDRYEKVTAYIIGKENEEIFVYCEPKHDDSSTCSRATTTVYNGEDAEGMCAIGKTSVSSEQEDTICKDQGLCAEQVHST